MEPPSSDVEESRVPRPQRAAFATAAVEGDVPRLRELLAAGVPADTTDPEYPEATALYTAASAGQAEAVRLLIEAGADVRGRPGYLPLLAAAANGNEEIVRDLLRAGADVHTGQHDGTSALSMASGNGHLALVRQLLEAGAGQGEHAGRAVAAAAAEGHRDVVRVLLDAGIRPAPDALVGVVGRGDPELVRLLLGAGCDPNAGRSPSGYTALGEAVSRYRGQLPQARSKKQKKKGQPPAQPRADPRREVIELLLAAGADVNARTDWGGTALQLVHDGERGASLIPLLAAAGADLNAGDAEGVTPLMQVLEGRPAKLQALLAAGADPNARDAMGRTALHHSGRCRGAEAAVRALLAAGADPEARDAYGRTPLMALADATEVYQNVPAMRALLEAGADLRARDHGGLTALAHACERLFDCQPEAAELLRQAGAGEDGVREVELRRAAEAGDRERVRALLAAGADVNAATWGGSYGSRPSNQNFAPSIRTPLSIAVAAGHPDVVRDLIAAGARVDLPSVTDSHPGLSVISTAVYRPPEIVEALLAAGADARTPDAFSRTPLLYAARVHNRPVVERLLGAGVPVDELAGDYLKVLEFPAAAERPEYRQAVAEVAAACGTAPLPVEGLPGVTCFRLQSRKAACALQAAQPDWHHIHAEILAAARALDEMQGRFFDRLLAQGLSLVQVQFMRFTESVLGLFPTTDPFAVVASVGPYQKDDPFYAVDLLRELHRMAADHPFRLPGCTASSLTVETDGPAPPQGTMFDFEPVPDRPGRWRGVCDWWGE